MKVKIYCHGNLVEAAKFKSGWRCLCCGAKVKVVA